MIPAVRLLTGGALAWCVALAVIAPDTPPLADVCALIVIALTFWRSSAGLTATLALAPAGLLLAKPPVLAAELLTWAFLSAWLMAAWRPLATRELPREVLTPALLYGACVLGSWLGLTIGAAAGVEPLRLPALLFQSVPTDYLLFSSPEPETRILLQTVAGIALYVAAMAMAVSQPSVRRGVACALVVSMAALAVATVAELLRMWVREGFAAWVLLRYVGGERFSLHLADLNATGSLYVLAILVAAALALCERPSAFAASGGRRGKRRWVWAATIVVILPALWLTGSRSASLGAMLVGASVIPIARRQSTITSTRRSVMVAAVLAVAVAAAVVAAARQPAAQGSAAMSARLRLQFFQTSARMFVSAPAFGVGVGRYHERSAEFMPAELRAIYPYENAHNYFAQEFAELGLVGGLLFIWLIAAGVGAAWRAVRAREADAADVGLCAGVIGYLLTCITGHPLLVPEAALPFFAAFGVIAATRPNPEMRGASRRSKLVIASVVIVLGAGVARQAVSYARTEEIPGERGFHPEETADAGTRFRWMTRHGVTYIGPQPGYLTLPVRAPELPGHRRSFAMEVFAGGRRVGVYEVPHDRWLELQVPVRQRTTAPFRRVDLWVNQEWTRARAFGDSRDVRPLSVMVGTMRWEPAR